MSLEWVGRHLLQGELQEGADEAAAHLGHQAEESGEVQFNVGWIEDSLKYKLVIDPAPASWI